jgi:L-ascorbate metabolism protein UlaG (beta-lactamase superfamily)
VKKAGWRRWVARFFKAIGLALVIAIAAAVIGGWTAFGKRATGERRARMERSPEWKDGAFRNPQPLRNYFWRAMRGLLNASSEATPSKPPSPELPRVAAPPASGLRVTWLGHSTTLVEIDGHRILTDPVWSMRVGPLSWAGPSRWYAPPIAIAELPALDAVVISHDHYDHLDRASVLALSARGVPFIVPLGVGAHLAYWGVPESRIVELDWWDRHALGDLQVTCTPARHASGRTVLDNDAKLWAGWAFAGPKHRVWYSGDTGLFPAMRDIGARLGPFDLTMIEVGQYDAAWPDWHIGPEQAVRAHGMVRGKRMLPVHWGLLTLAYHAWTEPIERALAAAKQAGVEMVAPRPGQSFEPDAPPPLERWWPELKWKSAAEHPIISSQVD